MIRLALLLLAILVPCAVLADPIPAMNCAPPTAAACGAPASLVPVAQALNMKLVRVRTQRPHLINDGASFNVATAAYVTADIDPIATAAGAPDTSCGLPGGAPDYPVVVNSVAGFVVNHQVTADFIDPGGTPPTVCLIVGNTLYLTKIASYYVNTSRLSNNFGNGMIIPALQAAGIGIELNVFNASNPGGISADGPLLDQTGSATACTISPPNACDTMYQNSIAYLHQLMRATGSLPYIETQGNEEDGGVNVQCANIGSPVQILFTGLAGLATQQGICTTSNSITLTMNGDWGDLGATTCTGSPCLTMPHQIQKMRDLCIMAHSVGAKCADGGIETIGFEAAYADELWNICGISTSCFCGTNAACRKQADLFQQWGFNKTARQQFVQANLQTTCETFTPPYLTNNLQTRATRAEAILAEEANTGSPQYVDYPNFHWYDVPGQGMGQAVAFFSALTGKPFMADEVSIYTFSWPDMVRILAQAKRMGLVIVAWWNQGGGGQDAALSGPYSCSSGCSPSQVPIYVNTGAAWNAYFTGQKPQIINGFAPPQPFCPS